MMTGLVLLRNILLALHFLGAAAWVGGMFYALVVLRPAVAALEPAPRGQVQMRTLKRFFGVVWVAMPLMLLTGWAMVFLAWGGFASLPASINTMQLLALIMAGVFLYTYYLPWQRVRRAIRPGLELFERIRTLLHVNVALGALTIIAGSLGHVW